MAGDDYAQWRSQSDYEALSTIPLCNRFAKALRVSFARLPRLWGCRLSTRGCHSKFLKAVWFTLPNSGWSQETSNASWVGKEYITIGLQHPDLISANFHRPWRCCTMNYGQWRSLENFEELRKDPKYAPLNEYWRGLAENEFHLYEVVSQNLLIKSSSFSAEWALTVSQRSTGHSGQYICLKWALLRPSLSRAPLTSTEETSIQIFKSSEALTYLNPLKSENLSSAILPFRGRTENMCESMEFL